MSSPLLFLRDLDGDLKRELLAQIRDLWTHTSTALEGNTLTLGDPHFVLREGLTISGKPIKDHQEVVGHARAINVASVSEGTLHEYYAEIHMGIVHVHPFWDGNGRIARLLANIPLLKAGLPSLTIPPEQRRNYIQLLADYQITIGQPDEATRVWPDESLLADFNQFCESCYGSIRDLVAGAYDVQKKRV